MTLQTMCNTSQRSFKERNRRFRSTWTSFKNPPDSCPRKISDVRMQRDLRTRRRLLSLSPSAWSSVWGEMEGHRFLGVWRDWAFLVPLRPIWTFPGSTGWALLVPETSSSAFSSRRPHSFVVLFVSNIVLVIDNSDDLGCAHRCVDSGWLLQSSLN
jgi:hypothetical protein